ncbi:MAG: TonB family protein [bacterium]
MNYDIIHEQKEILRRRDRISLDWAILMAIILHTLILYIPPIAKFETQRVWQQEQKETMQMARYSPPPPPPEEMPAEQQVQKKQQVLAKPIPQREAVDLDNIVVVEDDFELVYDPADLETIEFADPQALPDEPLRVGGDVRAPTILKRVEPKYPEIARRARIQGLVILEAIIDKNGNVRDVKVIKSLNSLCDEAAVEAAKQWKFEPGTQNDIPIDVIMNLTVQFMLK